MAKSAQIPDMGAVPAECTGVSPTVDSTADAGSTMGPSVEGKPSHCKSGDARASGSFKSLGKSASFLRARQLPPWPKLLKIGLLLVLIATVITLIATLPIEEKVVSAANWIKSRGVVGAVCFVIMFALSIVLGIPSTFFEVISGFIYGLWVSILVTTLGKAIGMFVAFMLGSWLGKETIGQYLVARFRTMKALRQAFTHNAWQLAALTQAAYVPIFLKCYGLSMIGVPLHIFMITGIIVGIPYTVLWSYTGSQANDLLDSSSEGISTKEIVIASVGIILALISMIQIGRYANRQLAEMDKAASEEQSSKETTDEADKKDLEAQDIEEGRREPESTNPDE